MCDARDRDFPWIRRTMALGMILNAVSYVLMGPLPVAGVACFYSNSSPNQDRLVYIFIG